MGIIGWCCNLCCCCDCTLAEDWSITTDSRGTERGAGWLYKRGKGHAVWSKRFFTITQTKLLYWTNQDRATEHLKGEIVMAGARAQISSTRANGKRQFYFTIEHPECGIREFYAKTAVRRTQWIDQINFLSAELANRSCMGKLLKQGGMGKNSWQERWTICVDSNFDYFDGPTDNQPKGSIELLGARVKDYAIKEQKYCFEITAAKTDEKGKKTMKKYTFACAHETDLKNWLSFIKKGILMKPKVLLGDVEDGENPLHAHNRVSESRDSVDNPNFKIQDLSVEPPEKSGYLSKKSPSVFAGWQKRWFVLQSPGEVVYYGSEEDYKNRMKPKGDIQMNEINGEGGVTINEGNTDFVLGIGKRAYYLRASDAKDAEEWVDAVKAWSAYILQRDNL